MKPKRGSINTILFLFMMLAIGSVLKAQGNDLALRWHTVGSGGGSSTGGDLVLNGVIGHWNSAIVSGGSFEQHPDFLGPRTQAGGSVPTPTPTATPGPPTNGNRIFIPIAIH